MHNQIRKRKRVKDPRVREKQTLRAKIQIFELRGSQIQINASHTLANLTRAPSPR
jgi:hypothetical protein